MVIDSAESTRCKSDAKNSFSWSSYSKFYGIFGYTIKCSSGVIPSAMLTVDSGG